MAMLNFHQKESTTITFDVLKTSLLKLEHLFVSNIKATFWQLLNTDNASKLKHKL